MAKGFDDVLAGSDAGLLSHLTHYTEVKRRVADSAKIAHQWKAKAVSAEKKVAEASQACASLRAGFELKLKEKEAELEKEKNNFASVATKLTSERAQLETLAQRRATEMDVLRKQVSEEHQSRRQAEMRLKEEMEKNKSLEKEVEELRASLGASQAEKVKVISGFPGLVQKLIASPEFRKPLAPPYDACIRLGRHQTCCKILEADPEFDMTKLGDHFDEGAYEKLQQAMENMFLPDYPFLSAVSGLASEPADVVLALEPTPKDAGEGASSS